MNRTITDEQISEIRELASQGYRWCDIAKKVNVSPHVARYYGKLITTVAQTLKKRCHSCKYRSKTCCEYLIITGHRRGCSPYDCDKYVKGEYVNKRNPVINTAITTNKFVNRKAFERAMYSQENQEVL